MIVVGKTNVSAYLEGVLEERSDQLPHIAAAYPVGGWEFPTVFDAISQIKADASLIAYVLCLLLCAEAVLMRDIQAEAIVVNDSVAFGIPSWRLLRESTHTMMYNCNLRLG